MTTQNSSRFLRFSIILLLVAYLMPWITHSTQTLTLNAYDLAEWTTLHPASRSSNPALLESFLLRCQLVIILWLMISTVTNRWSFSTVSVTRLIMIVIVSVSLLPPIDQLTNLTDLNYTQQTSLALFSLVGALAISISTSTWRWRIQIILLSLALMTALVGVFQSGLLMQSYDLSVTIGVGAIAYIAIITVSLVAVAITTKKG